MAIRILEKDYFLCSHRYSRKQTRHGSVSFLYHDDPLSPEVVCKCFHRSSKFQQELDIINRLQRIKCYSDLFPTLLTSHSEVLSFYLPYYGIPWSSFVQLNANSITLEQLSFMYFDASLAYLLMFDLLGLCDIDRHSDNVLIAFDPEIKYDCTKKFLLTHNSSIVFKFSINYSLKLIDWANAKTVPHAYFRRGEVSRTGTFTPLHALNSLDELSKTSYSQHISSLNPIDFIVQMHHIFMRHLSSDSPMFTKFRELLNYDPDLPSFATGFARIYHTQFISYIFSEIENQNIFLDALLNANLSLASLVTVETTTEETSSNLPSPYSKAKLREEIPLDVSRPLPSPLKRTREEVSNPKQLWHHPQERKRCKARTHLLSLGGGVPPRTDEERTKIESIRAANKELLKIGTLKASSELIKKADPKSYK